MKWLILDYGCISSLLLCGSIAVTAGFAGMIVGYCAINTAVDLFGMTISNEMADDLLRVIFTIFSVVSFCLMFVSMIVDAAEAYRRHKELEGL